MKCHLAGTQKDAEPCRNVSDEVRKEMCNIVFSMQKALNKKKSRSQVSDDDEEARVGDKRKYSEANGSENIARFFYCNAIPFNVARSEEFARMVDSVTNYGKGFKRPSFHDIRVIFERSGDYKSILGST